MGSNASEHGPGRVISRRVKEARIRRGWTQQDLADRLAEIGYPLSRVTVVKLERDPSRIVSMDELFALACALGTAPVFLITPLEDDDEVALTPRVRVPAAIAREWIRGNAWLPALPDVDLREMPRTELRRRIVQGMTRDMTPVLRALATENVEAEADRIVELIHNPEQKENSDDG